MRLVSINADGTVDLEDNGHTFHLAPSDFLPAVDATGAISMDAVLTGNVTSADGVTLQTAWPLSTLDGQRIAMHVATQFGSFSSALVARQTLASHITTLGYAVLVDPATAS